ncbi:hypothetical protein [Pseudomonas sp. GL-B-16]|uniref:hypothetical protein n=1 Tax=Pseudomonas sp. GL-B-16 TaxID=2832373 RepID=UPI001CC1350A|nr:hypothetical protein [Pseudomonas sp. GL-B-16]
MKPENGLPWSISLVSPKSEESDINVQSKTVKRTSLGELNVSETLKRQKVDSGEKPAAKKEELKEIAADVYECNFRIHHGTSKEYKSEIKNFGLDMERKKEGATEVAKKYIPLPELIEASGEEKANDFYTEHNKFNYGTRSKDTAKSYGKYQDNPKLVRFAVPDDTSIEEDPREGGGNPWDTAYRMGNIASGYIFSSKGSDEKRKIEPLRELWHKRLNDELETRGYAPVNKAESEIYFSSAQSDSEDDTFSESS